MAEIERFTIRWERQLARYGVSVPELDMDGRGVEVVRWADVEPLLAEARTDERRKVIAELYERAPEIVNGTLGGGYEWPNAVARFRDCINFAASLLAPEGEGGDVMPNMRPDDPDQQAPHNQPAPPSPEPAREGDDWRTRRLIEIAEQHDWRDPRALLARCLLYAEQERPPSGGVCADIEVVLGIAERPAHEEGSAHG